MGKTTRTVRWIVLTALHPERDLVVVGYTDDDGNWHSLTKELPDYTTILAKLETEENLKPRRNISHIKKLGGGPIYFERVDPRE